LRLLIALTVLMAGRGVVLRRAVRAERAWPAVRIAGTAAAVGLVADAASRLAAPGPLAAVAHLAPALGLLAAVTVLFAPAPAPPPGTAAQRIAVAALVRDPAADTLAPFALRRDRSYVTSPDGRAAVGYRVLAGTAIAGGDPVGAPGSHQAAVDAFTALCARNNWRVAVLGASDPGKLLWPGLRAVGIGDEAVLDVAAFDLAGRRMRNVRQAVARTHNAGVRTELYWQAELPAAVAAELAGVVRRWAGRERGFSMNLDGLSADRPGPDRPPCLIALARDRAGAVVGFQRYAECAAGAVLTLDAMPRLRGAPNGVNERLIADTVSYAKVLGTRRISLNFAAFRTLLEAGRRSGRERLGYRLLRLLDPLIKVEPLYRFNAKFGPCWQPRSVLVGSLGAVGWVLVAALGMEFALPYDRAHAVRGPRAEPEPVGLDAPARPAAER
jgi:lysyl-tRNA synthetase class 2